MGIPVGKAQSVVNRTAGLRHERASLVEKGAFFATVASHTGAEQVKIVSMAGNPVKPISFAYPFASSSAWIRGQPEVGTTMLSILGSEARDIRPVTYYDPKKALNATRWASVANAIRQDPNQLPDTIAPYRTLTPGDIDSGSNFAQQFLGLKDVYQARGGLSHFTMTSSKTSFDSPQFIVNGPHHFTAKELNDETRFGAVRRVLPLSGNATVPALVRGPLGSSVTQALPFAKEHTVVLNWLGVPGKLIDHRQGIVVDDDGSFATSSLTQQNLRARYRWFTTLSDTSASIDKNGNFTFTTSLDALSGGSVTLPVGSLDLNVQTGKQTLRSAQDAEVSSSLGRLTLTGNAGFRLATGLGNGEIEAPVGISISSNGVVKIASSLPAGIQLVSNPGLITPAPVLVGNPVYLSSLESWLSSEAATLASVVAYGGAAAAAWAAIGAVMAALDPTMTVPGLCAAAGGAATAMAGSASAGIAAVGAHMATLGPNPAGFLSTKVIAE